MAPETAQVDIGEYKYGFSSPETPDLQDARGPRRGRRARDLGAQERAAVDARLPPQGLRDVPAQADADAGAATSRASTSSRSSTTSSRPSENARSWDDVPDDIKNTFDRLGIPEAEKKFLAGVGAQYESEVVYHSLQKDLEDKGVIFLDTDQALQQARGPLPRALGDDHPAHRQQVRRAQLGRVVGRLVHLRAAGRQGRAAAAGLLPHQRAEHGPVRADADHRRRGRLRALRRGLHGADVLERLAALGRRRDRRQEGRPLPLHDHPELVEQRLQPRHQARRRLRGRHHGVGRRQPRLEADDEVPGGHPQGAGRARRGALDRLRRRGPAPGRRRQDHAHGARTRPRGSPRSRSRKGGGRATYRGLLQGQPGRQGRRSRTSSATR